MSTSPALPAIVRSIVILLLELAIVPAGVLAADLPVFPPPPRLATTAADLAKRKAGNDFAALRKQAIQAADAALKEPIPLPDGWGNWVFYYACPADGSSLTALNPREHQCPRCRKVYSDERTQQSYGTLLHDRANATALQLAWAYAYTGDDRYSREVRRILVKYADDYARYPKRRDRWGNEGLFARLGGRRYSQSLDEAVGIIQLAKAYDLTRTSAAWDDAQRKHVEQDFFRATADTLLWSNLDINNHQTWYNAGLMAIASVLADGKLVDRVLTMRGGFRDQLRRSVGSDGHWYEGAMAYHNYALQAMIEIADAGRRLGLPLHQEQRFRAMIEAPFGYAYPNGQFPAINDSDPGHLESFQGSFLWAWQAYGDPIFAHAWAGNDKAKLATLLGPNAVPKSVIETRSRNLEGAGLAVLRRGSGAGAACVMLDHGPHGGGHGHFDKLNIVLYSGGREWILDPGRLTYSHKEYKTWVKHTAAHNTVALGGRSQAATTGRLLWFDVKDDFAACAATSDKAYAGAILTRYLLLTDKLLVDVFDVEADSPTRIDWFAHAISQAVKPRNDRGPGEVLALGDRDGYEHLVGGKAWTVQGQSQWDFIAGADQRLRLWLAGEKTEKIIASTGIGYSIDSKVPCLTRRVDGRRAQFVTVYDLTLDGSYIREVKCPVDGKPHATIDTGDGSWTVQFGPEGVKCSKPSKSTGARK